MTAELSGEGGTELCSFLPKKIFLSREKKSNQKGSFEGDKAHNIHSNCGRTERGRKCRSFPGGRGEGGAKFFRFNQKLRSET